MFSKPILEIFPLYLNAVKVKVLVNTHFDKLEKAINGIKLASLTFVTGAGAVFVAAVVTSPVIGLLGIATPLVALVPMICGIVILVSTTLITKKASAKAVSSIYNAFQKVPGHWVSKENENAKVVMVPNDDSLGKLIQELKSKNLVVRGNSEHQVYLLKRTQDLTELMGNKDLVSFTAAV